MQSKFFRPIKRLSLQLIFLLACYFICRCVFTIVNVNHFDGLDISSFLGIAFVALRFDISAVLAINALYIFLLFLPRYFNGQYDSPRLLNIVFIVPNCIAILFEISDWAYFPYNHKRATADVLHLIMRKGDFLNLLPRFLIDYWYTLIAAIIFISCIIAINRKIAAATALVPTHTISLLWQHLRFLSVIIIAVIGIRGGLQYVPLGIRNVVTAVPRKYAPIALNTPFSIMATLQNDRIEPLHYFDEKTLKHYINTTKQFPHKSFTPKNVVVIILESFSKEFTSIGGMKSYTPFLDSLMQHSLVCTNAFANANRSADGVPAILAGIPAFQEEPFTTSIYGNNRMTSLPNLLATKGYHSAFYHGGTNGTMSLDLFAANAGFEQYNGRNEYPNKADYDGNWGIFDEPFLQFAVRDFGHKLPEPFCASIFTLSSHPPFIIPKKYAGKFPKGNLDIHETIGYTDHALRTFFATAQKEKWFLNTLFVLVADHCSPLSKDEYYHVHQGRFAIPIIYFCPGDAKLKGTNNMLTQQIDLLPSVMDYLGYNDSFFAFGNSIFSAAEHRYTVQHWSGDILWTMDNYFLRTTLKNSTEFFDAEKDKLCTNNLRQSKDSQVKISINYLNAVRQVYSNAMINNTLWVK